MTAHRILLIGLLGVVPQVLSSSARADDLPLADPPQLSVEIHTGLFGPMGVGGVALEYSPTPYLALGAGVGATVYGWRASAGARLQLPFRRHSFGIEGWYSFGPHEEFAVDDDALSWEQSHWVRVGLSYQYTSDSWWGVRAFGGPAIQISTTPDEICGLECRPGTEDDQREAGPGAYVGAAFRIHLAR